MGRRRHRGRDVNGLVLLDKPIGLTSNDALQRAKHLYNAAKAGHTGSLDPLATGLLPLCFGGATKLSAFLLDADKRYRVRVRLGERTATGDAEGDVTERDDPERVAAITSDALAEAVACFVGTIEQLPPMYSAVKHEGKRLYKLAREGIEVERKPRQVRIHELSLLETSLPEIEFDVRCSKGTYVRVLAEDIGAKLGVGAHVVGLRRTGVGGFVDGAEKMVTLERLQELAEARDFETMAGYMLPMDAALEHWPAVKLSADATFYIGQGQPVLVRQAPTDGMVRLYDVSDHFLGVGTILDDGRVQPKRLL